MIDNTINISACVYCNSVPILRLEPGLTVYRVELGCSNRSCGIQPYVSTNYPSDLFVLWNERMSNLKTKQKVNKMSESKITKFKKLNEEAIVPTLGTEFSAGFDLYADEKGMVKHGEQEKVKTGIAVAIPIGYVGFIKPRSGLSVKKCIDIGSLESNDNNHTMAGVVDSDYRGEVIVVLRNHARVDFHFEKGERIAQLVVLKNETQFEVVEDLDETERGEGGFSSTGN